MDFKTYLDKTGEIGYVDQTFHSIVYVKGLPGARSQEVILFETGELGQVFSLTSEYVEVLMLSKAKVNVGMKVARTDKLLEVSVSESMLGKSIDPLGYVKTHLRSENNTGKQSSTKGEASEKRRVEVRPKGISARKNIDRPLVTGATIVDLIIPLGKGQRELVIGDRKTGKTQFLLQSINSQALKGTICIYAAIAKKRMDIKMIENFIKERGIAEKCVVVASSSSDPAGLVFLTPYTAMTFAEYFKDKGEDVLVILDDLSAHAKYYREITLLAKRFPGRSSYPGDIFYVHSRLLERAGNYLQIKDKNGKFEKNDVSISCLPVAEMALGDFSGYIQTNLMAMTDGHIFFDSDYYNQGRRPAVNPFLSVTRVGRQAQTELSRDLNRQLTSFLVNIKKLREFLHFGAELSESTKRTLGLGDRIQTFFDQDILSVRPLNICIVILSSLWAGLWKNTSLNSLKIDIDNLTKLYEENSDFRGKIDNLVINSKSFKELVDTIKQSGDELYSGLNVKI